MQEKYILGKFDQNVHFWRYQTGAVHLEKAMPKSDLDPAQIWHENHTKSPKSHQMWR